MSTTAISASTGAPQTAGARSALARLLLMRAGYLFMGIGLVLVKWPLLPGAHNRPLYEGVTISLLIALSLLAFLGLRYPSKLLPVLLFEVIWKLLWLASVALPKARQGDLEPAATNPLVRCLARGGLFAVTPW